MPIAQTYRVPIWTICGGIAIAMFVACLSFGQSAPSPAVAPLREGWQTIDERFVFLTVELSSVEASLNAVNGALVAAGRDQAKAQQRAENYAAGNSRMDRQGGGPMDWQDFYGKTARNFYYHSSGSIDVQGQSNFRLHGEYQGKDTRAIERPPQFDYIYRANSDALQCAETDAAALGNKIDQLLSRRRELEAEQSSLWCKIALRGLSSRDLAVKALYRYELPPSPTDNQSTQRYAAISAECKFMRTMNLLVKQVQPALDGEQAPVFAQLQQAVGPAREDLDGALLNLPILADALNDPQSEIGQFDAAAKRLDDLSQNLVGAYRLAGDGDKANDDQRKDSFRAEFQQTVMDFAATVLTADVALTAEAADWNITTDSSHLVTTDPQAKLLIVPTALQTPATAELAFRPSAQPPAVTTQPPAATAEPPTEVESPDVPPNPPDTKAINAEREQLASAGTRALDETPFTADQELSQVDKPYEIKDVYGPDKDSIRLKILVSPGVEIRGGKIALETGKSSVSKPAQLFLNGTDSRPIVLRHVEIDQPLGGLVTATRVIFDQCTFRKTGGWFAYYSSKWEMNGCLLYKCKFGSLSAVDYGFKLNNCTLVGMDLPEIVHRHDRDTTFDYMDRRRTDWNVIKLCKFVDCTVLPTVFWCSEDSNFWNCTFLPGAAFKSDTPTRVVAFVHGTTGVSPEEINLDNAPERAPLTIFLHKTPFPVLQWAANCPIPELRHDDRYAGIVLRP